MVTINVPSLVKVIISMILYYHGVPKSIIANRGLLFISKFWSSMCYFLQIKKKLPIAFYP